MSTAQAMAAAAAFLGVAAAWEALAAIERARAVAWLHATWRPLARAGSEGRAPSPPERRRLALVAAGCVLAAGWLAAGPLAGGAAAVAAPLAVGAVASRRRRGYRRRVAEGAAPAARALSASLAAGRPIRAALQEAGRGVDGPAGRELRALAAALEAGEGTAVALERLRRRAGSRSWDTLAAAIMLQRDTGGDLAALLRDLAAALEDAERSRRDARSTTAQARFTAWLVAAIPVGGAVLAELASPGFLAGLAGRPLSAVLAALALVLELVAVAAVRAIDRGLRR